MPEINTAAGLPETAQLDLIRTELADCEKRRPDVFALARVASLARSIEPELLRTLRVELKLSAGDMPVTVAAESGLWFSDFVESRGADGITLLPEALQVLRPLVKADPTLLEAARKIIDTAHESAPEVLKWEERLVYLALAGRQTELQEQVLRGIGSIRDGTRLPLANWIADMWPRLPPEAATHPLMAKLHEMAAGMTLRRATGGRGSGDAATDWVLDFSGMATRELGVVYRNGHYVIGDLPDAEYGIQVPNIEPVELDVGFGADDGWDSQRTIERGTPAEIDVARKGLVRLRTLAGRIYELSPEFFKPPPKRFKRFRVAFSFAGEKRSFVALLARLLAEEFGEEKILYDEFHDAEFARHDLGIHLPKLYHKESDLVVIVLSPGYDQKQWTGSEWTAILDLLSQRTHDEVILCRFDHAAIAGFYSTAAFIDLDNRKPEDVRDLILERLALIDQRHEAEEASSPSSANRPARTTTPNNLPHLQPFFGRAAELNTIRKALDPNSRTWGTLIAGPGGVGKTSLAVRAAYDCPPGLFQRIVFVSVKEHERVYGERAFSKLLIPVFLEMLNELARELGQPDITRAPGDQRVGLLLDALRPAQALLILDNLDSLSKDDPDQLFTFVKRLPRGCKAILTSRLRLGSDSELILERLEQDAALALLADLARHNPLLTRTSEVDRISLYTQTAGKPLLMRWVAGQLGRGRCKTISAALAFLRTCPPDNDPLEFIFGDLAKEFTADEEKVLCALTHFSLSAKVQHIAEIADLDQEPTGTALHTLANRSLVVPDQGEEHYTLGPMVGHFLRRNRPEAIAETNRRLEERAGALIMENGFKKHDRFPVLDNMWQLVTAAIPLFLAGPNERLQTVCDALQFFLDYTGRWDESISLANHAERRAVESGDFLKAGWRATDEGRIYTRRLQADQLAACADRALDHFRRAKADNRAVAWAIRLRGMARQIAADYPAAIAAFEEALRLWRSEEAASVDVTIALNDLAEVQRLTGNFDAAARSYHEALRLARELGYSEGAAEYTGNLATLALERNNLLEAEALAREALATSEKLGRQELTAANSQRLGEALVQSGRLSDALPYARRAVEIYTRLGSPQLESARQTLLKCEPLGRVHHVSGFP